MWPSNAAVLGNTGSCAPRHDGGDAPLLLTYPACCCPCAFMPSLQAPANLPSAVGVLVEEGPGSSFLVKVNCRDRHGLLSDITQALGNLPLQVRGAGRPRLFGTAVWPPAR